MLRHFRQISILILPSLAKKRTTQRASKARRRPPQKKKKKKKKKSRGILYSLTRLIVVLGIAAALHHYWPQLRALAERAPNQLILTSRAIAGTTELQIALAREGFSPGSIDGASGSQTKRALLAYQTAHDLPQTGSFDEATAQFSESKTPCSPNGNSGWRISPKSPPSRKVGAHVGNSTTCALTRPWKCSPNRLKPTPT